jgi:hypothetical protein
MDKVIKRTRVEKIDATCIPLSGSGLRRHATDHQTALGCRSLSPDIGIERLAGNSMRGTLVYRATAQRRLG